MLINDSEDGMMVTALFMVPATVAFREGLEIALILAIILSYLRKTNQLQLARFVYTGAIVAFAISTLGALVLGLMWNYFEGPALAMFEGATVIAAAVLLTSMVFWMWHAGPGLASEIESSAREKSVMRRGLGLAILSFTLVLREGLELVLFSLALAFQDVTQTYVGVTLGLMLALAVGVALYRGTLLVSTGFLFRWTSFLLVFFAAGMVAYGIHELQEAGLLLIGPGELWNVNPPLLPDGSYPLLHENGMVGGILKAMFGYNGNPSGLEFGAYVVYLLVSLAGYKLLRQSQRLSSAASPRASPIAAGFRVADS